MMWTTSQQRSILLTGIVVASLLTIGVLPLIPYPGLTWHDQQRLGQIVLSALVCLGVVGCFRSAITRCSRGHLLLLTSVIVLGFCSASLSRFPLWAFAELSLLIVGVGIGVFAYALSKTAPLRFDLILGIFIRVLLWGMVLQFYVSYLSALMHLELVFNPWSLLYGFSNPRHQGQFLTIMLPLLVGCEYAKRVGYLNYPKCLDIGLMVSIAVMVCVAGTRGSIFAWFGSAVLFYLIKGGARKVSKQVAVAVLLGIFFSWFMLEVVFRLGAQEGGFRLTDAQVLGLSSRELIWGEAVAVIIDHPWFGIGPMHFAALGNPIAAHPHQAWLQIASEWGVPAFFLLGGLVFSWMLRAFQLAVIEDSGKNSEIRWCILFSLLSALIQSMVDGVLVMPYPQIWLSIVIGWGATKFHTPATQKLVDVPLWIPKLILIFAVVFLIILACIDYQNLLGAPEFCPGAPRFWCNGRID